ncbi:MAG: response regulator [Desulfobacterales bacterium]|jgi:DNA-binding NarL/FixJ family response regulator
MLSVYIVDDSKVMRERLTESVIDLAGIQIAGESGDPVEALDGIKKAHPDVVILDIRLPQRSGIDVLKDIKEDPASPIVIMITNYPYRQYRQACMAAGADYFFSKLDEFEMIRKTLGRIGRNHQNKIHHIRTD